MSYIATRLSLAQHPVRFSAGRPRSNSIFTPFSMSPMRSCAVGVSDMLMFSDAKESGAGKMRIKRR